MSSDYKKEWIEKSAIDYFSPFISLWLACNSWYMYHYTDLNDSHSDHNTASDRDFINKLKEDVTGRNHLYNKFADLIMDDGRDGIVFRTDIELLHYSLDRANLKPNRIKACSFHSAVIDYRDKDKVVDLIKNPRINRNNKVNEKDKNAVIKLDKIYVTSNLQHCFSGLIENIYQVRNMLVHCKLNPKKDEHDVVKYCYRILCSIMK